MNKHTINTEDALELAKTTDVPVIAPMPGKQAEFLETKADRVIFGGALAGGKSHGLKIHGAYHLTTNKDFNVVIARRTLPEIRQAGGLWEESQKIYPLLGGVPNKSDYHWTFPLGNKVRFIGILDDRKVESKDGGQFTLLGIDEAQHWEEHMVEALWMRARGISGIRPQLLMTCNPKKKSWIKKWIAWYLDEQGYPIPERSGVIRWFMRDDKGLLVWFDTMEDALDWWAENNPEWYRAALAGDRQMAIPESFTFISSKATDNVILQAADPDYQGKLDNAPLAIRKAKRDGCWEFDDSECVHFKGKWLGDPLEWTRVGRQFFDNDNILQATIIDSVRGYDFGYIPKTETNNPDFTTSTLMCILDNGITLIADHEYNQLGSNNILSMMRRLAKEDPEGTRIVIPDEIAGGIGFVNDLLRDLPGLDISKRKEYGAPKGSDLTAKEYRFLPFARQCQTRQLVKMVRNDDWNERVITIWEALGSIDSKKVKKDDCDSASKCYNFLHEEVEQEYDPFAWT